MQHQEVEVVAAVVEAEPLLVGPLQKLRRKKEEEEEAEIGGGMDMFGGGGDGGGDY